MQTNKTKTNSLVIKMILVFVLLQPILDFYIFFETSKNSLASVALPTIVRFVFMAGLTVWTWLNLKQVTRRKAMLALVVVVIYSACHWLFAGLLYRGPGHFSWMGELFYLARLTLPLIMLFVSQRTKYPEKQLEVLVYGLIFMVTGTIVVLNLLGNSLGSYTHRLTQTSLFDWSFDPNQNGFLQAATKGVFMYANQVSSLLVFLLPLGLMYYLKRPTVLKFIGLLATGLASLMLGTRVATLGFVVGVGTVFAVYGLRAKVVKRTVQLSLAGLLLGWGALLGMSPMVMRSYANLEVFNSKNDGGQIQVILDHLETVEQVNDRELLVEFIGTNYQTMSIATEIITEKYDYRDDPEFWAAVFREPLECRNNNRCIQDRIAVRIANRGGIKQGAGVGFGLKLFGTGYTRSDSLFPIEKDFLSQFRNLGLVGLGLFVAIYLIVLGIAVVALICTIPERRLEVGLVTLAIGLFSAAAYLSGNTLDGLFVTLIVTFLMGQYVSQFKTDLQWFKIKHYLKKLQPSHQSTLQVLELNWTEPKSNRLIVTANPETFEKALDDDHFDRLLKQATTVVTPDGIGVIWAARLCGQSVEERVAGVDLTVKLLEVANAERLKLSSLGAAPEVVTKFKQYIECNYPKIKLGRVFAGYDSDRQQQLQAMAKARPQLVLMALGSGTQEKVADQYLKLAGQGVAIGVGGTLDALTGHVKRAPEMMIRLNLEWLYRAVKQPQRIVRLMRYNGKFALRILALYGIKLITLNED